MKKKSYYERRGIKTNRTYTRAYHGILVKDYGFNAIMKDLREQYPEFGFLDNRPIKASRSLVIDDVRIKIFYNPFEKPIELRAIYDLYDQRWYFIDEKVDEYVNIKKLLRTLRQCGERVF